MTNSNMTKSTPTIKSIEKDDRQWSPFFITDLVGSHVDNGHSVV